MTLSKIAKDLLKLFAQGTRFARYNAAITRKGIPTGVNDSDAYAFCLLGGMGHLYGKRDVYCDVYAQLKSHLPSNYNSIAKFNDEQGWKSVRTWLTSLSKKENRDESK